MFSSIRRLVRRESAGQHMARLRFRPQLHSLEERAVPSRTILVDDDRVQYRNADFTSIQAAVTASHSGDTILVARGTYQEQVVVPNTLNHLTLLSTGGFKSQIVAPATFRDGTGAIVHVNGGTDIAMRGFSITGPQRGTASLVYGVLVDNRGSADVSFNQIVSIRANPRNGAQVGVGIQVGRDATGAAGKATIYGNTIQDYQKGGVVIIGQGSTADVAFNTVKGAGPTNVIAQNGIQVSAGAGGSVRYNTVFNHKYTGPDFEGINILVQNTANVQVLGNYVYRADEGILVNNSTGVKVEFNGSYHNTFNGIGVVGGNSNQVTNNLASFNASDGINLEDTIGNRVEGNGTWFNRRDGIALEATARFNTIRKNVAFGNTTFDIADVSTGTGTGGTANTWDRNSFRTKNPRGLR